CQRYGRHPKIGRDGKYRIDLLNPDSRISQSTQRRFSHDLRDAAARLPPNSGRCRADNSYLPRHVCTHLGYDPENWNGDFTGGGLEQDIDARTYLDGI